jgi:hypothetical protein
MARDDVVAMREFLKARLRQDEAAAHALKSSKSRDVARLRERVLADIEAKRQLMHWVEDCRWEPELEDLPRWQGIALDFAVDAAARMRLGWRKPVIDYLVAAYADHPDFQPEWGPIEDEPELNGEYKPSSPTRGRAY